VTVKPGSVGLKLLAFGWLAAGAGVNFGPGRKKKGLRTRVSRRDPRWCKVRAVAWRGRGSGCAPRACRGLGSAVQPCMGG
jgi:hypothetical protein